MQPFVKRSKSLAVFLCFALLMSGCATLKPDEYAQFGYKGEPEVQEGRRVLIIDWLGNIFGVFSKLSFGTGKWTAIISAKKQKMRWRNI